MSEKMAKRVRRLEVRVDDLERFKASWEAAEADVHNQAALDAYARQRSSRCPFMETKTFCSNCRVHCYEPEMREKIREVMRFSGPRMIVYHPVTVVRHVIETKKEKRRLENAE